MFDNHDLGMPGLGNNLSNFSSSEDLDVLVEDLSKTLDNTHISDNYDSKILSKYCKRIYIKYIISLILTKGRGSAHMNLS